MNKNTIIFDFDNTLVNSLKYWFYETNITTFKLYGLKPNKNLKNLRKGKSNREIAEIFINLTGLNISTDEILQCWHRLMYDNYTKKIKLIKGAKEYLHKLKADGKKLILATATNIELINKILPHFNLDIFDEIYTEETLKAGKNNPLFFVNLLNKTNEKPENVFFFEDSMVSILNATNKGINCCAIIHKYNRKHKIKLDNTCEITIKNYKDKKLNTLNL